MYVCVHCMCYVCVCDDRLWMWWTCVPHIRIQSVWTHRCVAHSVIETKAFALLMYTSSHTTCHLHMYTSSHTNYTHAHPHTLPTHVHILTHHLHMYTSSHTTCTCTYPHTPPTHVIQFVATFGGIVISFVRSWKIALLMLPFIPILALCEAVNTKVCHCYIIIPRR